MSSKSSVNLYKLKCLSDRIIYGYIRPLEDKISFEMNIIPLSIIQLCFKYFAPQMTSQLYAIYTIKSMNKFGYIDIRNKKVVKIVGMNNAMIKQIDRICFMDNFRLSSKTIEYFQKENKENTEHLALSENKRYSAMITCDKTPNESHIIFHENQSILKSEDLIKDVSELKVFTFKLPSMNTNNTDDIDASSIMSKTENVQNMVYSNYYGLIVFNHNPLNRNKCIYNIDKLNSTYFQGLQFNDNDEEFKWKDLFKIDKTVQKYQQYGYYHHNHSDKDVTSKVLCLINSYSSIQDKLLSFQYAGRRGSGYYATSSNYFTSCIKLYSLSDGSCVEMENWPNGFQREKFGTYYDITTELLYILGGDSGCCRSVNRYDFNKNKWFWNGEMQFDHPSFPFVWMDGFILYVAGGMENRIGTVECFDTRYNKSCWTLSNKDLQIDQILPPCKFKKLFGNNSF